MISKMNRQNYSTNYESVQTETSLSEGHLKPEQARSVIQTN